MNDLEFSFDNTPWEDYLDSLSGAASAMTLLTLMEGESEETFEDVLSQLEEDGIELDISELPLPSGSGEAALRLRQEVQLAKKGLRPEELEATLLKLVPGQYGQVNGKCENGDKKLRMHPSRAHPKYRYEVLF